MITDSNGKVELKSSNSSAISNLLGTNISVNNELLLGKNARITLVTHENCAEILVTGAAHIKFSIDQINVLQGGKDTLAVLRELPACYIPIKMQSTNAIGGLTLRGNFDPVWKLRKEFQNGVANNSTLITLISHDLDQNKAERARPYFILLKSKMPESPFIKSIENRFSP